jgi:hypothetical protein
MTKTLPTNPVNQASVSPLFSRVKELEARRIEIIREIPFATGYMRSLLNRELIDINEEITLLNS